MSPSIEALSRNAKSRVTVASSNPFLEPAMHYARLLSLCVVVILSACRHEESQVELDTPPGFTSQLNEAAFGGSLDVVLAT